MFFENKLFVKYFGRQIESDKSCEQFPKSRFN